MRNSNERLLLKAGFGDIATAIEVAENMITILHKLPCGDNEVLEVRYLGSKTEPQTGESRYYVGKFARFVGSQ